jgi:hypothetical protein
MLVERPQATPAQSILARSPECRVLVALLKAHWQSSN